MQITITKKTPTKNLVEERRRRAKKNIEYKSPSRREKNKDNIKTKKEDYIHFHLYNVRRYETFSSFIILLFFNRLAKTKRFLFYFRCLFSVKSGNRNFLF